MLTLNQIDSDNRKMKRFIGERLPQDGTRIVLADGTDGPAWVDLIPLWDEEGECDLVIDTNEPGAFGLRDVYDHLRRKEMTGWEWDRELAAQVNRLKIGKLERENVEMRGKLNQRSGPEDDETSDQEELPKEVSTAEAARILGVSKDTVLKMKAAGLLEYRNTCSPDSCRPVYAFSRRSVLEVRTTYQRDTPPFHRPEAPHRHQVKGRRKHRNFTLLDD